jgi:hypothetical protein
MRAYLLRKYTPDDVSYNRNVLKGCVLYTLRSAFVLDRNVVIQTSIIGSHKIIW